MVGKILGKRGENVMKVLVNDKGKEKIIIVSSSTLRKI
jgi:hypothetical protein